jgi:hypothetical protein
MSSPVNCLRLGGVFVGVQGPTPKFDELRSLTRGPFPVDHERFGLCVIGNAVLFVERHGRTFDLNRRKEEKLFDELRPLSPKALTDLEHYCDIELTHTSNAIEGSTLSPVETTLVIEKGITVSGKPLKDHLEALDHA